MTLASGHTSNRKKYTRKKYASGGFNGCQQMIARGRPQQPTLATLTGQIQ